MREIRRRDRAATNAENLALLDSGQYGVLATTGDDGRPYGVPLSYLYKDGAVYFHCASEGRKIDNLRGNNAATFTVVGATRPVYDKSFSTYYQSVIVSGTVREMTGDADKYRILYALAEKYLPGHMDKADDAIRKALARTAVYVLEPESVTGKAKRPQPVQS